MDIVIKKSKIGQFEKGVFANMDFKKGEVVIKYNLKSILPTSIGARFTYI